MSAPPVGQHEVAAWFDATYRQKGLGYLRPLRAYPIFVQLLGAKAGERLLDVLEVDARVLDGGANRVRSHHVVLVARSRFLELDHADADDVDPTSHGWRSFALNGFAP